MAKTYRGSGEPGSEGTQIASQEDLDNAVASATQSAEDAEASAASAQSSENSTFNLYKDFERRYLGPFVTAPTTDNDGDPLQEGALYWNTTNKTMYVWNGANWALVAEEGQSLAQTTEYTATEGQTAFSGTDDNGESLAYSPGYLSVSLNGQILVSTDYTATDGTTVTLADAATEGDILQTFGYGTFNVADHYTKAEADARFAPIAAGAPLGGTTAQALLKASNADYDMYWGAVTATGVQPSLLVNGGMRIWEEYSFGSFTTATSVTEEFTADFWKVVHDSQGGDWTKASDHPTDAAGSSHELSVPFGKTSELYALEQAIEGRDSVSLSLGTTSAGDVTISFAVKASAIGTFHVYLQNSARDRSYVTPFTVDVANTWEFKTIAVSLDQAGTWLTDSGVGLRFGVVAAASTLTYSTTADTWTAGEYYYSATQGNLFGATATFRLANVKVEAGSAYTGWPVVSLDDDMRRAERRWQKSKPFDVAPNANLGLTALGQTGAYAIWSGSTGFGSEVVALRSTMRDSPTIYTYEVSSFSNSNRARFTSVSLATTAVENVGDRSFLVYITVAGNTNSRGHYHWTADARI